MWESSSNTEESDSIIRFNLKVLSGSILQGNMNKVDFRNDDYSKFQNMFDVDKELEIKITLCYVGVF